MSDLTRDYDGTAIPLAGKYAIDPHHANVEFVARHLVFTKVKGRFAQPEGFLVVGEDPTQSSVEVSVNAASIDTGDQQRDDHLRSADFLDTATFPTLSLSSTSVRHLGGSKWELVADLTVRDQTHPVTFSLEFEGAQKTPWGTSALSFSASAEIEREAWGLTWNQVLESGGLLVGKTVQIHLEVEATPVG